MPGPNARRRQVTRKKFAQEAPGHNCMAVQRAHAKRALMKIPPLDDYEQRTAVLEGPET